MSAKKTEGLNSGLHAWKQWALHQENYTHYDIYQCQNQTRVLHTIKTYKTFKKNLGLQTILYNNTVNVSSLCIARPTAFGLCLWQSENYVSLAWKLAFAGMQTLVSQQKTYFCCATTCNFPSSLITKLYLYYYKLKIAF